jgi:hypothetical protein
MTEEGNNPGLVSQIVLAEFNVLRKEISDRSAGAQFLMNLNITGAATIAGFVLSHKADALLLLLIPLLSPCLGMLYVDHAFNIQSLGNYIQKEITPLLIGITNEPRLMQYENRIDEYERQRLLRFLPFGLPTTVIFAVAPISSLIFTWPHLDYSWAWILWGSGLLLVAAYMVLWMKFLLIPFVSGSKQVGNVS